MEFSVLEDFQVFVVVDAGFVVVIFFIIEDLKGCNFAVSLVECVFINLERIRDRKKSRFHRGIAIATPVGCCYKVFFQGGCQGLKRDTRIDAHDFTLAGKGRKWRAMKEHFLTSSVQRERDILRQYEYLVLTVSPDDSLPDARRRLVEHSEYGKWELERSKLYLGGGRRFWLRRRVMLVQRTV
ncbi:UNVERIFIED_ORG: hypothetical protein ABIB52_001247 [Arthrobacter sp. UYCu721]